MKRLPLIVSFFVFVALCMSISYWGIQMFKPKARAVAAPQNNSNFEQLLGQWGSVFGRSPSAQMAASNYQLKGVVVAPQTQDSAAIISTDGRPEQALAIGKELAPGVKLIEVHPAFILVSEAGVSKKIDLPQAVVNAGISFNPSPPSSGMATNPPPVNPNQELPTASLPAPPAPLPPPENSR
ncbi:type II secretion system protein N [Undibacterium sp. Ren11W]|uniref:type II secretion system protein N n=1 Tax=Undibacterium sp. Ren11W TaxID=3413045 RepID=UPI003BF367A1